MLLISDTSDTQSVEQCGVRQQETQETSNCSSWSAKPSLAPPEFKKLNLKRILPNPEGPFNLASTAMGRARKDSYNQPPIESYRKVIGKQDYKKSKSDLKESKKRAQNKKTSSKTYREIGMLLVFVAVALFAGCLLTYVLLAEGLSSLWPASFKGSQ